MLYMNTQDQVRILGISGSLRKASFSNAILRTLARKAAPLMLIDVMTLEEIPFYNEDLDRSPGSSAIKRLKRSVEESGGVLIATPEYNHGIPGVLKNALDWTSRPHRSSPLECKPVAMMGATAGRGSTYQAQAQVREALVYTDSHTLAQPELSLSRAGFA